MTEIYISCDVETDGPIPGPNSMLSLGAAAFNPHGNPADWKLAPFSTFSANLETLAGAEADPGTMAWWKTKPEAWEACRKDLQPPAQAMKQFVDWVSDLPGIKKSSGAVRNAVFVGYPAGFDFNFVYWYIKRFKLDSPFSFSALDIKTFAMAIMGTSFRDTVKRNMPKKWFPKDAPHTHVAVEDATEQGILFLNILAASIRDRGFGVYCLDGPAADTWCQHIEGHRIETDERTARTIARLFHDRSALTIPGGYRYEARELPKSELKKRSLDHE